jgi:hypothetical protein
MWKPEHRLAADRSGLRYPAVSSVLPCDKLGHWAFQIIAQSGPQETRTAGESAVVISSAAILGGLLGAGTIH